MRGHGRTGPPPWHTLWEPLPRVPNREANLVADPACPALAQHQTLAPYLSWLLLAALPQSASSQAGEEVPQRAVIYTHHLLTRKRCWLSPTTENPGGREVWHCPFEMLQLAEDTTGALQEPGRVEGVCLHTKKPQASVCFGTNLHSLLQISSSHR